MNKDDIKKVFAVWESVNKVSKPKDSKLPLDIVEQIASLFSAGNFYYYVFNFLTYEMDFVSDSVKSVLGISPEEFTLDKIFSIFHPDDLAQLHRKERASVNFKMGKISIEDITNYKTVYLIRFILNDGTHKTILHQSKTINVSEDGKIQQAMGVHTDVTHLDLPIDHNVSFLGYKKPNYTYNEKSDSYDLITLTKTAFSEREITILKEMSQGKTTKEIAAFFDISPHTVTTHKKNILKKSQCKNTSQLIAKCIREGII